MAEHRIRLWPMVRTMVLLLAGTGALLGAGLALVEGTWWLAPLLAGVVAVPLSLLALGMAWRTRRALERFVDRIGRRPEVDQDSGTDVHVRWPGLDVELVAWPRRGLYWRLHFEIGGRSARVQHRRVEAAAIEALGRAEAIEPDGEPFDGDIDGPMHAGTPFGVALAGLIFLGLGLVVLPERYALLVGATAMVIAGISTVWGALWMRSALRELVERFEHEGRVVGRLRLAHAGIQPRWVGFVGSRFVLIQGIVLGPFSRLSVEGLEQDLVVSPGSEPQAMDAQTPEVWELSSENPDALRPTERA